MAKFITNFDTTAKMAYTLLGVTHKATLLNK